VSEADPGDALAPRPLPPDQREPWRSFLATMAWVGVNTFGGPVAQIGVMQRECVEKRRWLSDGEFVHLLNFANIIPGPEALEIAIHLGYLRRGMAGGIVAGLLFIWPGFVSLTLLGWLYARFGQLPGILAALDGIRPVALALVAAAAVRLSARSLKGGVSYALMAASFLASFVFAAPYLGILVGCGVLGLALGRYRRESAGRLKGWMFAAFVVTVIGGSLVWQRVAPHSAPARAVPHEALAGEPLNRAPLAEIAWVNTKAALVTFGGAYTVLPYLREQTVERHGWVTDREMMDALAFGETTPGPLISVGVFLSYLAGGLPGAAVGCLCLFLPSFLFVLGLGRHIDKIERAPHARAVLWGFSAGTLGLILALAAGLIGPSLPDSFAVVVAVAAFLAVWRFDLNIMLVVALGAALGLARLAVGLR
jgi:chromate transporter